MNLTIAQVAERLNVSQKTVRRRIESGEIVAKKFSTRCIRIDEEDLRQYEESHRQKQI